MLCKIASLLRPIVSPQLHRLFLTVCVIGDFVNQKKELSIGVLCSNFAQFAPIFVISIEKISEKSIL